MKTLPDRVYVPLIPASCDKCDWTDRVQIPAGTDALSIYRILFDAHKAASPGCSARWGAQHVRVPQDAEYPD